MATDLEQLIDAVERQPGARAYALLAERYLEQGEVAEALAVCERGFTANPAYERGAVAFLSALRLQRETRRAGEVYGRAVAEHPRSSQLRVAWAKVLLDAGREYEARLRTREAVNLDPMNRDARALLATLGGTPPPSRRTTGGIELHRPETTREYTTPEASEENVPTSTDVAFSDVVANVDAMVAAEPEESGTREYANPPPEHPPLAMPQLRRGADARFDFTPAPVLRRDEPAPPVDTLADFFDVPEAPPPAAPGRVVRAAPRPAAPPPIPQPPPVPQGPPTIEARGAPRHDFTGPPQTTSQDLFPELSAPEASAPAPLPTAAPPATPAVASAPLEPPSDALAPLGASAPSRPKRSTAQLPSLSPQTVPEAKRRLWPIFLVLAVLALGGALGGWLYTRHRTRERVRQAMKVARGKLALGLPEATQEARDAVCPLAAKHRLPRLAATCALSSAELVTLYGKSEAAARASADLRRAQGQDKGDLWTVASFALLALHRGEDTAAQGMLKALEGPDGHVRLVKATILERAKRPREALSALAGIGTPVPVWALVARARLERLTQSPQRGGLTALAKAAPKHPVVPLERAYEALSEGKPPSPTAQKVLAERAVGVPAWTADAKLLRAHVLAHQGKFAEAARLAAEVAKGHGAERPESGWWAGRWALAPGGDATVALERLTRFCVYETYRPEATLWRIRALLTLSRPQQADGLLSTLAKSKQLEALREELQVAKVRIADALDERRRLQDLCPPSLGISAAARVTACAEALLPRGETRLVRRWWKRAPRKSALRTYLRGLRYLAQGSGKDALRYLRSKKLPLSASPAQPFPPIDPVRVLTARGQAQVLAGNFGAGLATLKAALSRSAGAVSLRVALAKALVVAARDTEALQVLEAVVAAKPSETTLLAAAGQAFVALGRPAPARALVREAVKINPKSTSLQLLSGEVALLQNRLDQARTIFRRVLKARPRSAQAHVALGRIAAQNKRTRRARRHFAAALRTRPKDPEVRQQLAMAFLRLRRYKDAFRQTKKAVSLLIDRKQRRRAVELQIAVGRRLRRGNKVAQKKAQELLFEASTGADPPPMAFFELGKLHRQKRDRARAVWCFKQAIKRDPKFALAYLELGLTQRSKRRWRRKARRNLKRYLALEPQGKHAKRVRKLLR